MKFEDYYLPWELAAKLALLGFNEACIRDWMRDPRERRLKPRGTGVYYNFDEWELYENKETPSDPEKPKEYFPNVDKVLRRQKAGHSLTGIFQGRNVAAPFNQQALDWFREKYEINVMQIPKSGSSGITYVCDPVGPGIGDVQLPECETPHAAILQCINHLVGILKPLEGCFDVEETEDPEPCEVGPND